MNIKLKIAGVLAVVVACNGIALAQAPAKPYSWANLPKAGLPVFPKDTFDIVKFGAKPGAGQLNTEIINKTIDRCSAKGGGVVLIPAGIWLTGPIVLKSNVNLHISRSALLQFTDDKSQFKLTEGNYEGRKSVRNQSPISGTDLSNIAITGNGTIDGHGEAWRAMGKDRVTESEWNALIKSGGEVSADGRTWFPSHSYANGAKVKDAGLLQPGKSLKDYEDIKDYFRPNLLVLNNCKKVLLQDVTFENSPGWCLHTLLCEDLTFSGVRVRNEANAQNGDGMDIESCANVLVENCTLDCGDDGICIKSGKDEEGRQRGKASKNILVRNNTVYKAHGGFVIGSEMSGGAHDIFVTDCNFIGTDNGLRFKTVRGRGGVVENIYIRNISMRDILHSAVLFDMYYFTKAPTLAQTNGKVDIPQVNDGTPQFRNFYINNLTCVGAEQAMLIRGLPEMHIKDIHFTDVAIKALRGADIVEAKNITFDNVQLDCKNTRPLINIENSEEVALNGIRSVNKPVRFVQISGDRSKGINIKNAEPVMNATDAEFSYGAEKSILTILK